MFSISCFIGGIAATNGYLVETRGGCFAVDAPEGFADWLQRQGKTVDTLLLTHQHFDHVMDAALIKETHGARIAAWSAASRDLTLEDIFNAFSGMTIEVPPFVVDEVLDGRPGFSAAGVAMDLFHVPGHSPDSVCFYTRDHGVIFGGDVLFEQGIGRTDFPGGSMALLVQGIRTKLLTLPDDVRVLPGHGGETTIGEERAGNPFLDDA